MDFLEFAAVWPLLPYIRYKLEVAPDLFPTRHAVLLENVVFGSPYWDIVKQNHESRIELAEILLQKEGCVDDIKNIRRQLATSMKSHTDDTDDDTKRYMLDMANALKKYKICAECDLLRIEEASLGVEEPILG